MPKSKLSDSESEENASSEEESENDTAKKNGGRKNQEKKLSDYEQQRLKRIEENKSRMEALGLRNMANSFMGSVEKSKKNICDEKGKRKIADEDEEYNPTQEDDQMSSSEEDDDNDDDFSVSQKKVKKDTSTPKKQGPVKKPIFDSDFVDDDDDAFMQAIALSLQDSSGFLNVRSNNLPPKSKRGNANIPDDSRKTKRKKQMASRVQMTEDEMLIHFFQFDETGNGGFTPRDVQRIATAHDFTWSEKDITDMIHCFDSDGDGKMSLEDFRKIVDRCGMLKGR